MKNKTLRMRLKASALAVALAALPIGAHAAGFGKITVLSALGQPLRAEIDISTNRDELSSLSARVASTEAFRQAGIDFAPALVNVRFSVEKRPNGQAYLLMKSEQPFNDPFLDLLVEMRWASGRIAREYTVLLDPPELNKPAQQVATVNVPEIKSTTPTVTSPPPEAKPSATEEPVTKQPAREPMKVVRGKDGIQRIVKTEPKSAPAPTTEATTRTVKHGDTLHKIAVDTKPEGVNLDQMLVALFRSNKGAFDGNINRLKAGKILTIPDQETAAAISPEEASKAIYAQSADFNAYRKKLAAATANTEPQKEEAAKQSASGKIAPKIEDKAPAVAAGKDKLEISKTEAGKVGTGVAGKATEEEALARAKELKEANSRISELEKNLSDLKKLGELKSQGLADLQKQAQISKPAAPATPTAAAPVQPTVQPATPATPAAVETKEAAAPAPAPTTTPVEPVKPPAAVKPAPKKPTPPPPPPQSFVDENPELVYGGSGVLTLLLSYLGFSAWSRKRKQAAEAAAFDANDPISESAVTVNSVFGSTGGQVVDTGHSISDASHNSLQTDFSLPGMDKADTTDGVDPIKEADVYMAYGRNAQAEEILLDALKTDPQRHELHAKLLEIYASRKSLNQFESIATDLHQQTNGSGPHWEKAVVLGQQIDPTNPLYGGRPDATPAKPAFDPEATMVMSPEQAQSVAPAIANQTADALSQTLIMDAAPHEEVPESLDFELDLDLGSSSTADQNNAETTGAAVTTDLDFDLGTSDDSAEETTATADSNEIDFDLGLDSDTPAEETSTAPTAAAAANESDIIDFDLSLDSATETTPVVEDAAVELELPAVDSSALDVDFDIDFPAVDSAEEETSLAPAGSAASGIDLSSISLDLDDFPPLETANESTSAVSEATAETSLDSDSLMSFDLDTPPLAEAAEMAEAIAMETAEAAGSAAPEPDEPEHPEVATKLELAQAYEEMGDKEGARELLQEVLNEGNSAQQAIARSKLEQFG